MAPYEALPSHSCRTPVCWEEWGDMLLLGSDLVQQTSDKIKIIKQ